MRLSFAGSTGWFGSTHSSRLPLPLVSMTIGVQPCDFGLVAGLLELLGVEPAEHAARPGRPRSVHSVLLASSAKIEMVRRIAGADQRDLAGLRIEHRQMPRRGARAGTPWRTDGPSPSCRNPDWAAGRRARSTRPGPFRRYIGLCVVVWPSQIGSVAPVGRRRHRIVLEVVRLRIAHRHLERSVAV